MDQNFGINQAFIEELRARWQENRATVGETWQRYFEGQSSPSAPSNGYTNGHAAPSPAPVSSVATEVIPRAAPVPRPSLLASREGEQALLLVQKVQQLVNAYRLRGHLWADLDPLGLTAKPQRELTTAAFGIADSDLDSTVPTGDVVGLGAQATVRQIVERLEETYCRSIGVEYLHIEDPSVRQWLRERMEGTANRITLGAHEQLRILEKLMDAEIFEQFLHTNFLGAKRFSLEGGEALIPLLDLMIERSGEHKVEEIVVGMAHRGRLNVLCNIMQKSPKDIFAHFDDKHPEAFMGRGDVKYHLGYSSDRVTESGQKMHLSLAFNPSHLEFVNPVVEGRVRAKQDRRKDTDGKRVVALLIHGDAAIIGQGVVAETFNLMSLPGYRTGGTLHVVVNNQIGFTTPTDESRSTRYATDLARMLGVPIFHVNGEDPEAVAQVTRLAVDYRQTFGLDVVIDMYCYRKWGHNEGDEPRYTQPVMYAAIDRKPSVRAAYVTRLVQTGRITEADSDKLAAARRASLEEALSETRKNGHIPPLTGMAGLWARFRGGPDADVPEVPTAVAEETLMGLFDSIQAVPAGFNINAKLEKQLQERRTKLLAGAMDWGTAEALAMATLLSDGVPIRLSGQDACRGTFSHRHCVWTDRVTGTRYTPLTTVARKNARFDVYNSPLSETGVLGFDYGYSLDYPDGLVLWEAQFGDFANGAQVIIDQFITSSEDKWNRLSGIVLLLPHGFEGAGPEHSSARLERFLQMASEDNIVVANLTTPAQLFHALRRQMMRASRKPLVIMTPKSHLRSKEAISSLQDLSTGSFQRIITDPTVAPADARKVLLCSGKVYFDLVAEREARGDKNVAILRLEQLYPLSATLLREALAGFNPGVPLVWVQEEPLNMGAWYMLNASLPRVIPDVLARHALSCVSRDESASPATGSGASHKLEQKRLVAAAFA